MRTCNAHRRAGMPVADRERDRCAAAAVGGTAERERALRAAAAQHKRAIWQQPLVRRLSRERQLRRRHAWVGQEQD